MGPKKDKVIEENMKDCVRRVMKDALQDQAILEGIANIISDKGDVRKEHGGDKAVRTVAQKKGRQNSKIGSAYSGGTDYLE
ncbi:hypothetical protein ANN_23704 [Periplaneta americana]|uniref:Uncharacterized protein n=1 Tax=Periplaneta americana TaxID=6978 RepID=A0ABQ8SMA1_PERAM|nr:hypothetical protein ANN_23704 [Periplaneta americana]